MEKIKIVLENFKENNLIDVLIAISIIIIFYIMRSLFSKAILKLLKIKTNDKIKDNIIYKALKNIIICLGIYIAISVINIPETWSIIMIKLLKIWFILNFTGIITSVISPESKLMKKMQQSEKFSDNKAALNIISKIAKILIYIVAGFMIIADLGYDLSGLITGLGLSSVVIALAAQELVGNLISGTAIISDKPFEIGDYIKVGNYEGTVLEIKFRSTKIKTTENTIITIQNSKIVSESVVNITKIDKRRVNIDLRLPLNTKTETINELMDSIKLLIYSNMEVVSNSLQINITDIMEDAIKLSMFFYINITDYAEFLKFKTKINLNILKLTEDKKVELACTTIKIKNNEQ